MTERLTLPVVVYAKVSWPETISSLSLRLRARPLLAPPIAMHTFFRHFLRRPSIPTIRVLNIPSTRQLAINRTAS